MARSPVLFGAATLLVVAAAVVVLLVPAEAVSVCNINHEQFKSCQPAMVKTSNPATKPSVACCAAVRGADLRCLCGYKNSPWLSFYNIDSMRAMELPAKCGLAAWPDC